MQLKIELQRAITDKRMEGEKGAKTLIKNLVDAGGDINSKINAGDTFLHLAARHGCSEIIKSLIHKDTIEAVDNEGFTALHHAAEMGHQGIVETLINNGANIAAQDKNGYACLHLAARGGKKAVVEFLLKKDKQLLNLKTKEGCNALHYAAFCGDETIVKIIVDEYEKHKISLIQVDNNKWNALHHAARYGHIAVVEFLIEKDPTLMSAKDWSERTPVDIALNNKYVAIAKILSERAEADKVKAADGLSNNTVVDDNLETHRPSLYYITEDEAILDTYKMLHAPECRQRKSLSQYTKDTESETDDANISDDDVQPPTYYTGDIGDIDAIEQWLKNSGEINGLNDNGMSVLHDAALNNLVNIMVQLLEKGADMNLKSGHNEPRTALHLAIKNHSIKAAEYLIEKGACKTIDQDGREKLIKLLEWLGDEDKKILQNKLNDAFSDLNESTDGVSSTLEQVNYTDSEIDDINALNENECMSLHDAAINNDTNAIDRLLEEEGVDINSPNECGWAPLHLAVVNKHIKMIDKLLEKGANINLRIREIDHDYTPLHIAIKNCFFDTAEYLIEKGACGKIDNQEKEKLIGLLGDDEAEDVKRLRHKLRNNSSNLIDEVNLDTLEIQPQALIESTDEINSTLDQVNYTDSEADDINALNKDGWTPLYSAVMKNDIQEIDALIEKGANVNTFSHNGFAPLHFAASNNYIDVVRKLVEKGATINLKIGGEDCGLTPLYLAIKNWNIGIAEYLIEKWTCRKIDNEEREKLIGLLPNDEAEDVKRLRDKLGNNPSNLIDEVNVDTLEIQPQALVEIINSDNTFELSDDEIQPQLLECISPINAEAPSNTTLKSPPEVWHRNLSNEVNVAPTQNTASISSTNRSLTKELPVPLKNTFGSIAKEDSDFIELDTPVQNISKLENLKLLEKHADNAVRKDIANKQNNLAPKIPEVENTNNYIGQSTAVKPTDTSPANTNTSPKVHINQQANPKEITTGAENGAKVGLGFSAFIACASYALDKRKYFDKFLSQGSTGLSKSFARYFSGVSSLGLKPLLYKLFVGTAITTFVCLLAGVLTNHTMSK